jgi:hypothetical protein
MKVLASVMLAAVVAGCGGEDHAAPGRGGADAADGHAADAAPEGGAGTGGPVIAALDPPDAPRGADLRLTITGAGFGPQAAVLFDGQRVATTRQSAGEVVAQIPANLVADAGFHDVLVESGPQRSAAATFSATAPMGWPEVVGLEPDNGAPGDTVRVVGFNISGGPLTIEDGGGHAAMGGAIGMVNTSSAVLESVAFTVPPGWQSGPVTITSAVGGFRAKPFNVGRNLARLPGVTPTASSQYGGTWTIAYGIDNDLFTSWFPAAGDCVSAGPPTCAKAPWYMVTFPAPQTLTRLALRGYRDYTAGYALLRVRFELLGEGGAPLWSGSYDLPPPDRDLDLTLPAPVAAVSAVRLTSEKDESEDPGFGELELF